MGKEKLQQIVQRAATDLDFRRRLIEAPRDILIEEGFRVPPGKEVVILESTDDLFQVVLPTFAARAQPETMPFAFKIKDDTVLLKGHLDAFHVGQLRDTLLHWDENLTLDLKDLDYISSAGLSLFLAVRKRITRAGYSMRLLYIQPAVRNVFILGGFDALFDI